MRLVTSAVVAIVVMLLLAGPAMAAGGYVQVGMPFGGGWGNSYSGNPAQHTSDSASYLWGDWAEDVYANETDVRAYVTAPLGGAISLQWDSAYTNGSCAGAGGWNVVVKVFLDGAYMGSIYFAHLANPFRGGTIQNGVTVLGRTHLWKPGSCSAYQVTTTSGVHTHVELRSGDGANRACWYPHTLSESLPAGTPIGRLGGTGRTGTGQACADPPTTGPTDSDGDGTPDAQDRCPNQPGSASTGGCPDADGDGIADPDDHCPAVARQQGEVDGCPGAYGMPFDANGDGKADLVHRWNQGVNTWLSNGDGTYNWHTQTAGASYGFSEGVWFAADANGDGKSDLIHRWNQGVNTWLSNGDGTYNWHTQTASASYGFSEGVWFAADANGDGKADLIHRWNQGVNTWLSNGDGTYNWHTQTAGISYGFSEGVWFAADANGDGKSDLIHRWNQGVNTWLSNGDGTYNWHTQTASISYGFSEGVWFAADANGDGKADLIHRWNQGVNTWLSNGDGTYNWHTQTASASYGFSEGVWFAADANGDGKADLIHRWNQGVNTWLSNGDGTYNWHTQTASISYGFSEGVWFAADANGDGKSDLIHRWNQGVNTWLSNGDGTYNWHTQTASASYAFSEGQWPASVYTAQIIAARKPAAGPPHPLSTEDNNPTAHTGVAETVTHTGVSAPPASVVGKANAGFRKKVLTVKLTRGCAKRYLQVSGHGITITDVRRLAKGRCQVTLRVESSTRGTRRLSVKLPQHARRTLSTLKIAS